MPCMHEKGIHRGYADPSAAPVFLGGKGPGQHLTEKRRARALLLKPHVHSQGAISSLITYLFDWFGMKVLL